MDKTKLITIAANSKLLKNLAKKLCNYRYISDDLFQEFLIYLLERPEELLIKKYLEVNFIFYCSCVIRGLNGKRLTANKLVNSKNPLCEKINIFELNGYEATTSEYNYELDAKRDKVINDTRFKFLQQSYSELINETGLTYFQITNKKNKTKRELSKHFKK